MGFQFLHIEAYARHGSKQHGQPRKWSAREIAAEAMREPDACPHVAQPLPPQVLHGCTPAEAAKLAHDWADSSQDAKGRKLRADGLALAAGVVSLPAEQRQDWPRFREATVAWLRQQYGERLRSVVEHTDEAHPHLHFYAVPLPGSGSSASPRTAGRSRKGPPRGQKGRTERRIQAGYGGVAGWLSKGRSGPFWAYAAWPWQAAADAGSLEGRAGASPVTGSAGARRAGHHAPGRGQARDQGRFAGQAVRERGRAGGAAHGAGAGAGAAPGCAGGASGVRRGAGVPPGAARAGAGEHRHTQRAELAERQAQELRRELEAERRKAAKAHELAELYRSGWDQAIDELRAIQPQRGHGLER